MIPSALLTTTLVVGASLLWAVGVQIRSSLAVAARSRRRRAEDTATGSLIAALVGDDAHDDACAALQALPTDARGRLIADLAAGIEGRELERLRSVARQVGVVDLACRRLTDRRWWERRRSIAMLGSLAVADERQLALTADPHPEVRAAAIRWCTRSPHGADLPALLLARLQDDNGLVRAAARDALVDAGTPAVRAVVDALRRTSQPATLVSLLEVAARVHDAELTLVAAPLVDHAVADVRAACAGVVGASSDPSGLLAALMDDAHPHVRRAAIRAAGEYQRTDLAGAVGRRLTDDDWRVRDAAARSLGALGAAGEVILRGRPARAAAGML